MKFMKLASIVLAAAFVLAGCSSSPNESSQSVSQASNNGSSAMSTADSSVPQESSTETGNQAAAQEYPIVIEHAFGETVIEEKPETVVSIAWGNQDSALALGVTPAGFSMANFGPTDEFGNHPWTAAKLAEMGVAEPNVFQDTDGWDYEAISDCQPDVILAAYSGITQEEYDLLSEIAPVVAYPEYPYQTSWRDQIIHNATGMGMKAEGEQYVADMDTLIADTLTKYPQLEGKNGAFLWISANDLSTFYIYFTVDPRAAYLTDVGVAFPESLKELQTDVTSFAATVSSENIDVLNDLDIIVAYGDEALLETLQADPLYGTVPAIQKGSVVFMDSSSALASATTPSALSIPAHVEEYVGLLAEAADKSE